ncbi:MAG: chemotaxis protein CheA, partial [Chloroflexota bacterium]
CYTCWDIILATPHEENAIRDVFEFVEHESELTVERLREPVDEAPKRLGEILVERGDIRAEQVEGILRGKRLLGQMLVDAGLVSPEDIRAALAEQRQLSAVAERHHDEEASTTIRVNLGKLDSLVNLVGELVTAQARLTGAAEGGERSSIASINEEIERHVAHLRSLAMDMRMVPIGNTFARFFRLVRDLSRQLEKDVELVTEGSETELDKRVIDKLVEPLTHLIRNAIDHGVECEQARVDAGKPSRATVRLSAEHAAGMIRIRVADDGRGLDEADILARAVKNGIVSQSASLSRDEILALIFEPGFSTAGEVTDLSGRGVGMDIVRRTVDALNGSLSVESERFAGTTVTIDIPLTLAIMDGLLVRVDSKHYVLPLASALECIELNDAATRTTSGRQLIEIREKLIPYLSLREEFGTGSTPPPVSPVVIAETGDGRVGLVVDEVIGQTQAVVKNLGAISGSVSAVSAATILGDGTVALVLDIARLVATVTGAGAAGAPKGA